MSLSKFEIIEAIKDLLPHYQYEWNKYYKVGYGVEKIVDTWYDNKANTPLFRTLEKHPNYNGRYQIILNEKFHREIDHIEAIDFIDWMIETCDFNFGEKVLIRTDSDEEPVDAGVTVTYCVGECVHLKYGTDDTYLKLYLSRDDVFPIEREVFSENQQAALRMFKYNPTQYLNGEILGVINEAFPWLKAHDGAKASKVFRRICKKYGLDKMNGFNARWPRFADSINPLEVKRWTIISWNPIDYLTMSFGTDWRSCHDIDKTGLRGVGGDNYHGCYSSGTLSYLEDKVSIVMYTVNLSYEGNTFEYEPKVTRQMFHMGDGIFVQGRLYPQGNDVGAEEAYETMRNIFQRVYSEAFGVPNFWTREKGAEACCRNIVTVYDSTHYRDYECYDTCSVNKLKGRDEFPKIYVGHAPICPLCGNAHDTKENIMCPECSEIHYCERCGDEISYGDGIETADGNYFCDEYCARESGYVYCYNDDAWHYNDEYVIYDEYDGEYYYIRRYGDYVVTQDGHTYYSSENAEEAGYVFVESEEEWIDRDYLEYCEECCEYVRNEDYDYEHDMCKSCASERESEVTA